MHTFARAAAASIVALALACGRGGGAEQAASAADRAPAGQRLEQPASRAGRLPGKVVRVRDGDSLVVLVGRAPIEVRLDGVDAPELAQAFGKRAKRCVSELAAGRQVHLEPRGKDAYDRTLAEVFLPGGGSLNRELVAAGCAWWFRRHSADRDLEAAERQARAARRGLWAGADPVPPWEFRETQRTGPRGRR